MDRAFFFGFFGMAKLSRKQRLFVAEYLVDLNATQAAIRAGYSSKTARAIGSENLIKPDIQAEIAEQMKARQERVGVDQDRVLLEIARLAFSDPRKVFDGTRLMRMDELDGDTAAAISSIKVSTRELGEGQVEHVAEIKFWPKTQALDMAGRHIGMFEKDNKQRNPADAVAAVIAEIQANAKRGLPSEERGEGK